MEPRPDKLEIRDGNKLVIAWSDGQTRGIPFAELRGACPCATCREARTAPAEPTGGLPVLSMAEARPLSVLGMQPVGHYA